MVKLLQLRKKVIRYMKFHKRVKTNRNNKRGANREEDWRRGAKKKKKIIEARFRAYNTTLFMIYSIL